MSLSSALATAISGLRVNQSALSVISSNVANAQTPGYVARTVNQIETLTGGEDSGVLVTGINRQLNDFIQTQLRTETSGSAFADQISGVLNQLQSVYGTPGADGTLETAFSNFTSALQALQTSLGNSSTQLTAVTAAQALAQQLNAATQGIQTLRSNAEQDINISIGQANDALTQIAKINSQLQGLRPDDPTALTLEDQRDNALGQLSRLLDIRVSIDNTNQATIYTSDGIQLVGGSQATILSFNSQGVLNATSQWNSNPALSTVGTISATLPNGAKLDLIATGSISSGQIGADLQLRDKTLVQAQTQIDQLAASLASALSDKTTAGTAAPAALAPKAGFDLDVSSLQPGNSIQLTYTDITTGTVHHATIVRVDDPAALPLPNTGGNPNDPVIGVNFSGGLASVVAQLNTALSSASLQFSNPAGSTLRVLDNGAGTTSVNAASVTATVTSLTAGTPQLPFFTDGSALYTGSITKFGSQQTGFAGRIAVNPALVADPTRLVVFNTSPLTTAGDTTRPDFLFSQLTTTTFSFSPQTGLGSRSSPLKATLPNYLQQFLTLQASGAASAKQVAQGQQVVVNTLQQKFNSVSGVNIDAELSNLIAVQNTYAANAHVMSVIQSMMQTLLQIQL